MLFERVFSEGLAQNSYIVGDGGVAAVIDPRRDTDIFLDIAAENNCVITHIFETHRNEDYVTGSPALAKRSGAGIYHGAAMDFAFGNPVKEGDSFPFGDLTLGVLETPGHTEESISLVLRDRGSGDTPFAVFCGDTLFAGDIARTDFFGPSRNREMAAKIYDSITKKILGLGDGVIVCPAHGQGSVCAGSTIADHPLTTCGYEKATNPFLRMGKRRFVTLRRTGSHPLPPYFHTMEKVNRKGPSLQTLPFPRPLTAPDVERLRTYCQVLDIRGPAGFAGGHIPGSISIWQKGISSYAGWFLNYHDPIVLVDDFTTNTGEGIRQLYRLGFDRIAGVLDGGIGTWYKHAGAIAGFRTCSVHDLNVSLREEMPYILDVRDPANRSTFGHIRNSHPIFVGEIPRRFCEIPVNETVYICCDAGFKAGIAGSILLQQGFRNIVNVLGGMTAWLKAGYETES